MLATGTTLGPYKILSPLGAGGMGEVYLAEDSKHNREVALKILTAEVAAAVGSDRFLREIAIAAKLTHPHILPVHDSGAAEGLLYYVMPYVEGESLRQRLAREKQLPVDDALRIAREVADALSYAHSHGVVHRDIKPENILLQAGHAVVADFGIARAIAAAGGEVLTRTGVVVGTPAYMSPEQAAGGDLDGRSDLYSLGCVLYEMLAGQPPFTGPTAESLAHQHLSVAPRSVTALRTAAPPAVDHALIRALAKTPADRYLTAAEFADALLGKLATQPSYSTRKDLPGEASEESLKAARIALIARSPLTMKSDISYLAFRTSDETIKAVGDLAQKMPRDSDAVFYINQGGGEITIICDAEHENLVAGLRYQAKEYRRPVGVLRIREVPDEAVTPGIEVPGLYAYYLGQLAENGINVLDVISTTSQLTLVLEESDLIPAFSLLNGRISECRRQGGM